MFLVPANEGNGVGNGVNRQTASRLDMDTALDDIAFLANSENRVAILERLGQKPHSRDELREAVDASRVTVARILRDLETRTWITRSGRKYEATPLGGWVCEEFDHLIGEMEAEKRVREALRWIPSDQLTFDIHRLSDAEITLLDGSDATAMVRRIVEFHRSGERVRGFARCIAPVVIETQWKLTVQGNGRVEMVVTPEVLDVVRNHPAAAQQFREMLATENARYFIDEDIPMSVGIVDDAVTISLTDERGVQKGSLTTDDEIVHAWAVDRFETCRDIAETVAPGAITV